MARRASACLRELLYSAHGLLAPAWPPLCHAMMDRRRRHLPERLAAESFPRLSSPRLLIVVKDATINYQSAWRASLCKYIIDSISHTARAQLRRARLRSPQEKKRQAAVSAFRFISRACRFRILCRRLPIAARLISMLRAERERRHASVGSADGSAPPMPMPCRPAAPLADAGCFRCR